MGTVYYHNVYQALENPGKQRVGMIGCKTREQAKKINGGPGWRRVALLAVKPKGKPNGR